VIKIKVSGATMQRWRHHYIAARNLLFSLHTERGGTKEHAEKVLIGDGWMEQRVLDVDACCFGCFGRSVPCAERLGSALHVSCSIRLERLAIATLLLL